MTIDNHEELIVRAFIQKPRQERCLFLLSHPKRRSVFTSELSHFKWLDERYAFPIDPKWGTKEGIAARLRQKGAGSTVQVISEDSAIDGKELKLEDALEHVWGRQIGTILSCIPGKLGYFEDEEDSRLLER